MCVVVDEPSSEADVLVRIQSSCIFSESLGAIDCDCNSQLKESIRLIKERGGLVVYLFEEGRGGGLPAKFQAVRVQQETGANTAQAFEQIGLAKDPRNYAFVARVLMSILGPGRNVVLLTNNPTRHSRLREEGVPVVRTEPLVIRTPSTEGYLAGKAEALGHEV
jgi:GTP cyclohydrolase II